MPAAFNTCVVRVKGSRGGGSGFLLPSGLVLTCAHVVSLAFGRDARALEKPDSLERLSVTFPLSSDPFREIDGTVISWHPLRDNSIELMDVAVIQIANAPPAGVRPAFIQIISSTNAEPVESIGFPQYWPRGRFAQATLLGFDGFWLHGKSDPNNLPFMAGHSGSPVFLVREKTVVAMVSMSDWTAGAPLATSQFIPISKMLQALPTVLSRPAIEVKRIQADEFIDGVVIGFGETLLPSFRLIVYVKIPFCPWYIHPFAAGGEGESWARINADGSWKIRTVRRTIPASSLAILVVLDDYRPPAEVEVIEAVDHILLYQKNIFGTEDYFKL